MSASDALLAAQIAGTAVFALSGVLAVGDRGMDWFGVVVIGSVTALGGGTIRSVVLDDTMPWIDEPALAFVAVGASLAAIGIVRLTARKRRHEFLQGVLYADALGLGLFAVTGADVTLHLGHAEWVAVVMAVMTAVGGGVVRDLLSGRTPLVLLPEIYATAALTGAVVFVVTRSPLDWPFVIAGALGIVTTTGLRLLAIRRGWALPVFQHMESDES